MVRNRWPLEFIHIIALNHITIFPLNLLINVSIIIDVDIPIPCAVVNTRNRLSPRGSMVEYVTRKDEIVGLIPTAGFL